MRVLIDGLEVRSGQAGHERCETTVESAGGSVMAITTALPDCGVVLNTCYLADFAALPLAASYLLSAPGRRSQIWQQTVREGLIGTSLIRACLLDHAAALRTSLEELWGVPVTITVPDDALEQTGEVWRPASR